jgi:putative flippase GtrA
MLSNLPIRSERARFLRFLAAGGMAACVNVASGVTLSHILRYEVAITLAYLLGMTTAFVLSRLFVFDAKDDSMRGQYLRFAAVNGVAFVQVWLVTMFLARAALPWLDWTWYPETVAHALGVVSPIITSYFGHKVFSFK